MKRKIAAVVMADIAGEGRALAGDARARLDDSRAIIADIVTHRGGRMLPHAGEALLIDFPSAVEAVRAALDVRDTFRERNKALPLQERTEFRLGVIIADVPEGAGDIPAETLGAAARLQERAAPGEVCISKSVREAVGSKLKLREMGVTVEGVLADAEGTAPGHVILGEPETLAAATTRARRRTITAGGIAALVCASVLVATTLFPELVSQKPQQQSEPGTALLAPDPAAAAPDVTTREPGAGTLEFRPALQPDPSAVLTVQRMLPKAWKDCADGSADTATAACKTLLDSGIAKGEELAEIQVWNGKALRERNELDKALEALTASIAEKPSPTAYSLRGTVHYDKGSFDQAIADYTEAIRLDSSNGEAFNNRAWTYYRAGRSEKALADAEVAVRLLSKESYVWDTRAHIHAKLGNREAAIRDFRAALAIDPKNAASKAGLASLGVN